MDVIAWLLAGAAIAWLAFSFLDWNLERGLIVTAMVGAGAAFFGGKVLAPVLGSEISEAGGISPLPLVIAVVTAVVFLKLADLIHQRYQH